MKNLLFFSVSFLLLFTACTPDKVQEGEVEYAITYPNSEISGFMQAILPETMTITFKGNEIKTTVARGKIFKTEVVSNEETRKVEMRLEFGDKLFFTQLNESEIEQMIASQPVYNTSSTEKSDSIVGLYASSYTVDCPDDTITHTNAWFTEDLAPANAYWFTSYAKLKGFPLIYDAERYGIMMHMEAVSFKQREVTETEFERDPDLSEVTFQECEDEIQELFDILME